MNLQDIENNEEKEAALGFQKGRKGISRVAKLASHVLLKISRDSHSLPD